MQKKYLVAYFSHSGNTRRIAEEICALIDADIFEIKAQNKYSDDYNTVVEQARQELRSNFSPVLVTAVKDIRQYEAVFIGFPNWWNTFPMPVKSFLLGYDFSKLNIIPFCTHEGSGIGNSAADVRKYCPDARVLAPLALRGGAVSRAQNEVSAWLRKLGYIS